MVKGYKCIRCGNVMVNAYVIVNGKMEPFGYVCKRCTHYEPPSMTWWWSFNKIKK
jgi:hypothetical protein